MSHRQLTPSLVLTALGSALGASLNDADDMMFRAESRVQIQGQETQRVIDEGFAGSGVSQVGALARLRVFDLLESAYMNPFGKAEVERVEISIDVRFGREVTELLSAQLTSRRDRSRRAGSRGAHLAALRRADRAARGRGARAREPGRRAARARGHARRSGAPRAPDRARPRRRALQCPHGLPSTSLVLSLQRKSRGMSLAGFVVRDLPGSMLDSLATGNDTARTPHVRDPGAHHRCPMGRVITGQAKLSLTVRKEKR